jgi:hypothetical protein
MTRTAIGGGVFIVASVVAACFWNNGAPDGGADAAAATVGQIFATSCAVSGCHTGSSPQQGLDLSDGVWFTNLVGVASTEVLGKLRVAPGDHASSYLMCKVDPSCTPDVGNHMPLNSGLSPDQVDTIRSWIDSLSADAGPPQEAGDTTPPTFAGATSATTPVPNSITLSWSAATDDVTPQSSIVYLVYESNTAGGEGFAAPSYTTAPGATSFAVGNLTKGTTYYYVVRAEDQAGNVDGNTTEVSATTLNVTDTTPPTFAGVSSATTKSASSIQLSWSPASDDYTPQSSIVYLVYEAKSSGAESYTAPSYTTAAGATSYTVTGLGGNTDYYYVVRAKDQSGNVDANVVEQTAKTSSVSFASDVWTPILSKSCTGLGCHAGIKPAESMNLSGSAATAYSNLVGVMSLECTSTYRVKPGDATTAGSYVMAKLLFSGPCLTGSQMPKTGGALPQAQIDTIGAWIGEGAPNN